MKNIALLDCTLRDGGYLVDKTFGESVIHSVTQGLAAAGLEIIEIGFLQDEGAGEGKTVYRSASDAEQYIPREKGETMYTVLADYSRYSISLLEPYTGRSFDAVRACFFKKERKEVLHFCREIQEKGYRLFVQPVDVLGYTDRELLELLEDVNQLEPFCFSIVDTFGSMYEEDLSRVFSLVHHNLAPASRIGFHSHNNLQMSSALSQKLIQLAAGKRSVVIDGTLAGMGRGAGNLPTELIVQFLNSKCGCRYDLDCLLDLIDSEIGQMRARAEWGYNTPYFIAGSFNAHVNNVSYLLKKNSVTSKGIRYVLNSLPEETRKRYDYALLERTYLDYLSFDVDDNDGFQRLRQAFMGRTVLMVAPGRSVSEGKGAILEFISKEAPLVVSINYLLRDLPADYLYMSNLKRYRRWMHERHAGSVPMIVTSNIQKDIETEATVISLSRLMKCGWQHMDNSAILLLRLLDQLEVREIAVAGLDGYSYGGNYAETVMENLKDHAVIRELNAEIESMLVDFRDTKRGGLDVHFLTESRFSHIFQRS